MPFLGVSLLARAQLATGALRWITSAALIAMGLGAAFLGWMLLAPSGPVALLMLLGLLVIALAAWRGDVSVRRAGVIGSGAESSA